MEVRERVAVTLLKQWRPHTKWGEIGNLQRGHWMKKADAILSLVGEEKRAPNPLREEESRLRAQLESDMEVILTQSSQLAEAEAETARLRAEIEKALELLTIGKIAEAQDVLQVALDDASLASSPAPSREQELVKALDNLRRWCREFMSYPAAMRQLGPILKDKLDGALFIADAALGPAVEEAARYHFPARSYERYEGDQNRPAPAEEDTGE